jgi:anti-sigma B factor antagonist
MIELAMQESIREVEARAPSRTMTVVLEGEISHADWEDLADHLFRLAHRGITQVVIDFSGVSHLDYRAVKPLSARTEIFRKAGGDVRLAGLSPYLHAIFRSAGANDTFDYFADTLDAVKSFDARRPV